MKLRDLLLAILRVANKARDVARIIRSEHALLELLVQEKKGLDKNERFVQDFKTLADVLIQQMVSHDIAAEFPAMEGSIFGEESNLFTNTLGETKIIQMCPEPEQTKQLLLEILDDNKEAATLLSEVVHREAADITLSEMQDNETEIPDTDVGIWIDPIGQYIRGLFEELDKEGITDGGLQCVAVLIGAFQKSTGLPVLGVAVQPFWQLDPESNQWTAQTTWGICYQNTYIASVTQSENSNCSKLPTILMSTSESETVKQALSTKFQLRFTSGAGYKLLCTAQRRVQAYVLSKSSIYLWDCCAPHAILRATGGGVVRFRAALAYVESQGGGNISLGTLEELEVNYCSSSSAQIVKSIDGIIAYSCPKVLEEVLQVLTNKE
ncbi:inositol polyphosphate 1-phosphatase-like isoform X2 [Pomacea canaliculata]|uniref:inositol polyphosphate 1-phosphatase-like isoform X2 n=1 Tax=Pomacea canaliculata TaxID=400727 RepID=UPI000D72C5F9|nr:inositol polyphosphate 1-phosphatase-like isoform X2 [Pomacea canaliculata]